MGCSFFGFFVCIPRHCYSQTEELECLKIFNSAVRKHIELLSPRQVDSKENSVKLVLYLYIDSSGLIDSVHVKKSNLDLFQIEKKELVFLLIGSRFSCFRRVYYENELIPDKLIVVYEDKFF